jgi:hypothetical protein
MTPPEDHEAQPIEDADADDSVIELPLWDRILQLQGNERREAIDAAFKRSLPRVVTEAKPEADVGLDGWTTPRGR